MAHALRAPGLEGGALAPPRAGRCGLGGAPACPRRPEQARQGPGGPSRGGWARSEAALVALLVRAR
eukprot:6015715-Alexandrium_andersonii.AAC.1